MFSFWHPAGWLPPAPLQEAEISLSRIEELSSWNTNNKTRQNLYFPSNIAACRFRHVTRSSFLIIADDLIVTYFNQYGL